MAYKENLRKQRMGTVINNTFESGILYIYANKHKISHNLKGLKKVLEDIDGIPTKEKLLSLGFIV